MGMGAADIQSRDHARQSVLLERIAPTQIRVFERRRLLAGDGLHQLAQPLAGGLFGRQFDGEGMPGQIAEQLP